MALCDVTLDFGRAGPVAVIGPNGAGKTTLLNVLTGFGTADVGVCHLGDTRLDGLAPETIARLGLSRTFQDPRLVGRATTLDNVMLAHPRQQGERLFYAWTRWRLAKQEEEVQESAMRLLTKVGLSPQVGTLAGNLSYGQQKVLAIACCMASDPHTLLVDEPVAGVHPTLASVILEALSDLSRQGKRVVFIEHDLDAVRQLATRTVVLSAGRVLADGPTDTVLSMPAVWEAYVS